MAQLAGLCVPKAREQLKGGGGLDDPVASRTLTRGTPLAFAAAEAVTLALLAAPQTLAQALATPRNIVPV